VLIFKNDGSWIQNNSAGQVNGTPLTKMKPDTQHHESTKSPINLEQLSHHFIQAFPVMDKQQQHLALALYRLLAQGKPVSIRMLADAVKQPVSVIDQTLQSWPGVFFDDSHNIVGFWGITIQEMPHQIDVNDVTVYTWCAWDTLFIPELLDTTAEITSHCAQSGDEIVLTISPHGIETAQPSQIMISFLLPEEDELKNNITTSFCHYVFFFRSREAGDQWMAEHPGTFLLSLDEAFSVGKYLNAARYNLTLN